MSKHLLTSGIVLALAACSGAEHVDIQDALTVKASDGVGPFYECFSSDYNDTIILPEAAYQKGECFMTLAMGNNNPDGSAFREDDVGANQHTLLQYANSWLSIAAESGHALANHRLSYNKLALYAVEDRILDSQVGRYELLASEIEFEYLDLDHNGLLTRTEASMDEELAQSFSFSDFDENGKISLAEYIIFTGEATAAGNAD